MGLKMLFIIQVMYLLETATSHHTHGGKQYLQYHQENDYNSDYDAGPVLEYDDDSQINYRRSRHHRRHRKHGNSGGKLPYVDEDESEDEETDECECSCSKCDNEKVVKPCCQNVCDVCSPTTQPNLILIPYPIPFMIKTKNDEKSKTSSEQSTSVIETTSTTTTTTATPTTTIRTTIEPTNHDEPDYSDVNDDEASRRRRMFSGNKGNSKYMLTSLRHTKPHWIPKYGIVPIPDKLAEKLIAQMREARRLRLTKKKDMLDVIKSF